MSIPASTNTGKELARPRVYLPLSLSFNLASRTCNGEN
jgi:hypothetical protein